MTCLKTSVRPTNSPFNVTNFQLLAYNFGRVHKSLRVTPAMQAGIADHVWTIEEIVNLVTEPEAKKRGPYKARNAASEG